jgi:two-component system, cell cycle sensor histidine kinase and response regulator CckA
MWLGTRTRIVVVYSTEVLVVSGDRQVQQLIAAGLGEVGWSTYPAATHEDALEYAASTHVDVVIVDVYQPDPFARAMVCELRRNHPDLKVLYLIGWTNRTFAGNLKAKAHDFHLRKPFRLDELCDIVSSWLENSGTLLTVTGISLN